MKSTQKIEHQINFQCESQWDSKNQMRPENYFQCVTFSQVSLKQAVPIKQASGQNHQND